MYIHELCIYIEVHMYVSLIYLKQMEHPGKLEEKLGNLNWNISTWLGLHFFINNLLDLLRKYYGYIKKYLKI